MTKQKTEHDSASDEVERLELENENMRLQIELFGSEGAAATAKAALARCGLTKDEILARAAEAKAIASASEREEEIYRQAKAAVTQSEEVLA